MAENLADMLIVGGKSNSLARVSEVIEYILHDPDRLEELYSCLFNEDAWVRIRAADARESLPSTSGLVRGIYRPTSYDLATSTQPSIQWHLAQIYREVDLTPAQNVSR